jgi:hypothetical protein
MTRVTGKLSSGTLLYMSPEQLNGDQPKPAQDIYSFAAMVYECLKGEPPFVRGQIEHQILNNPPPPLNLPTAGPSARGSGTLAASVMAGLAKKPENRPASCMAVLEGKDFSRVEHVERVESGGNGRARSPSVPQSGGPRPVAAVKGLLAVVALGLAAFGGWWFASGRNGTTGTNVIHVTSVSSVADVSSTPSATSAVPASVVFEAGHKGVQLWEGGPYWATTNIGAEKPEDYGYYFWWGDTVGYKREGNAWVASNGSLSGFSFGNATTSAYSIEVLRNKGWITADGVLAPEHDAAHVHWGGAWRMPTKQELDDLSSKCDWKWTTVNGVNGREVRGRGFYASKSIFLPCAGYGNGTSLNLAGSDGNYCSSVPYSGSNYSAWSLGFDSGSHSSYGSDRDYGQSVRPVQGFAK